jgi:hypothetical protein
MTRLLESMRNISTVHIKANTQIILQAQGNGVNRCGVILPHVVIIGSLKWFQTYGTLYILDQKTSSLTSQ